MALTGERGEWVSDARRADARLFSELDVLLRALDRFFDVENFSISNEDLTARNFYEELITARDAILRVLGILEVIMPESRKNAYWFQKFAESKLLTPRKRDIFRENIYKQDSEEKGLYLLYDSFINLKGVISDLSRSGEISYMGFMNIGGMIGKEIRENVFFNPFRKDPNPEFDTISNPQISEIVKNLPKDLKKYISVIYVYLFRILRYLGFVDLETRRSVSLNSSLIILFLVKSEINVFQAYAEKAIKEIGDEEIGMLLQSAVYQFSMESRRVYRQELRDVHRRKASPIFRGKIENSHGILKNLTEHSVIQLAQYFRPDIQGEEVFSSFLTKVQLSMRLREDIVALHKFILLLQKKSGAEGERVKVFESLRSYMVYFESFTYRLLRYEDYEEFVRFFDEINAVKREDLTGDRSGRIMDRIGEFGIYLETTLRHIGNRAELSDKELDVARVDDLVRQHL